jgi:hypothetical protein
MQDKHTILQALNAKVGMKAGAFHVAPSYSGGSPARVDEDTAIRVAVDEAIAYERHIAGIHGEENKARAQKHGLSNVVYFRWFRENKTFRYDLLTQALIEEPQRLSQTEIAEAIKLRQDLESFGALSPQEEQRLKQIEEAATLHRQTV